MSDLCKKYVTCASQGMSLEDILKAVVVKSKTQDCCAINILPITGDCGDFEQAIKCGTGESWQELIMKTAVLDDCGNPAILVFGNISEQ